VSRGAAPGDFTQFETLQGSSAMGSANRGRLTNLKTLNVDTSWYFRYRSTQNPDLGASFPQLLNITNQTAIPLNNSYANSTIQAIANVAAIHFAFIEQGGSSLYPILALKATDREVLRILLSRMRNGRSYRATDFSGFPDSVRKTLRDVSIDGNPSRIS
jgi:hypothetical protein